MMSRPLATILLLIASNTFMTIAWYGHLRFKDLPVLKNAGLITIILISWGIALLEYSLMVPANRIGSTINGGPFNMWQLKLIQEVISISVFIIFTLLFFKTDELKWNHIVGFLFLIGAVYFFFKK
ncbi:DMT family protein [Aurantibacillus circumpalustris]|uniref:DMT family protein n=1 Tax=Aurantibacillus circumpalustris TaxID=3036359 RepID=UPI00295A7713|nr:DMT family protein [Aurantibacillus circumpalustris]